MTNTNARAQRRFIVSSSSGVGDGRVRLVAPGRVQFSFTACTCRTPALRTVRRTRKAGGRCGALRVVVLLNAPIDLVARLLDLVARLVQGIACVGLHPLRGVVT